MAVSLSASAFLNRSRSVFPTIARLGEAKLRIDHQTVAQVQILYEDMIRGVRGNGTKPFLTPPQRTLPPAFAR